MSRLYDGEYAVRVVFEHDGEYVHAFTDPGPFEDADVDCFRFGLGVPYWHGLTPVRVVSAKIVEAEEAA